MSLDVRVTNVVALIVGEPRQRQAYTGQGEARKVTGRAVDAAGRPVSGAAAVVVADPLGLIPDAQVLVPDSQATALQPGSVVSVDGEVSVRLAGGDFGAIRATLTGERLTPLGDGIALLRSTTSGSGGKAPGRPGDGGPKAA